MTYADYKPSDLIGRAISQILDVHDVIKLSIRAYWGLGQGTNVLNEQLANIIIINTHITFALT